MHIHFSLLFDNLLSNLYGGKCGDVAIIPPLACLTSLFKMIHVYLIMVCFISYLVSEDSGITNVKMEK